MSHSLLTHVKLSDKAKEVWNKLTGPDQRRIGWHFCTFLGFKAPMKYGKFESEKGQIGSYPELNCFPNED